MRSSEELEKKNKKELISMILELQEEYESLQQENDDLYIEADDLKDQNEYLEDDIDELEKDYQDIKENRYDDLLRELRFNTELQDKLFSIYKDYFLQLLRLYCVDIPDEIYNAKLERNKIDIEIYQAIEDYIEDFTRFRR